jgi:hypothetical protein
LRSSSATSLVARIAHAESPASLGCPRSTGGLDPGSAVSHARVQSAAGADCSGRATNLAGAGSAASPARFGYAASTSRSRSATSLLHLEFAASHLLLWSAARHAHPAS